MPLSPDLFSALDPPAIWVSLSALDDFEGVERSLTVRIKERSRRSISATVAVDRYSPEPSIFRAVSECLNGLATAQRNLTAADLYSMLRSAVIDWVDPF